MKPITIIHISTMQRNCLEINFGFNLGERLIINRDKIDWETLNTSIIKTAFSAYSYDYGTRIRFKCHKPIKRKAKTLEGESCTNWDSINSFGVRLDLNNSIDNTDGYNQFYGQTPEWFWDASGEELFHNFHLCKNKPLDSL